MDLAQAKQIAAAARQRIAETPCDCKECIINRNLPAVQRILKKWKKRK